LFTKAINGFRKNKYSEFVPFIPSLMRKKYFPKWYKANPLYMNTERSNCKKNVLTDCKHVKTKKKKHQPEKIESDFAKINKSTQWVPG
jgi:hypothetical protein